MTDRISSDHPSIETVRATVVETPTGRRIELPGDERSRFPDDEVIRIVLDGTERFARVDRALTGDDLRIAGVYDSPSTARDPGGEPDRLDEWLDVHDVDGGSVLLDVVEPDFLYGARAPGESAVYAAKSPPDDSLSRIADRLDGAASNSDS
ncbi:DUF7112 family protein [Halovivax limisalsi]|uniref:DUF7112 family protein n=1 Tax=Halovivax limisalsi TaxID=1453760 RepID=UPI001FFDAE9B|nr:hypothetical protein [Halovivax limisalsi]